MRFRVQGQEVRGLMVLGLVLGASALTCNSNAGTETCASNASRCFSSLEQTGAGPSGTYALAMAAAFTRPPNGCHNSSSLSFFGNLSCSNGTQANLIQITGGGSYFVYICCNNTNNCNNLAGGTSTEGDGAGDGGSDAGPEAMERAALNQTEFTVNPPRGRLETLNIILLAVIGLLGVAGGVAVDLAQRNLLMFSDG